MENTSFCKLHPLTSFLYFFGAICLSMMLQNPIYLGLGLVVTYFVLSIHTKLSKRMFIGYLILLGIMILLNPIFVREGSTTIFSIYHFSFTLEALMYGLKAGILIIITLLTFLTFNQVITSNKFLYLFSKILPKGAMLLALALRFVPLFIHRIQQIDEIQTTRGLSVRVGPLKKRIKAGMLYMQVLLTFSLEEALQTADSMKARGYTGKQMKRTSYQYFRFNINDWIAICLFIGCFLSILIGKNGGFGAFLYFPKLSPLIVTLEDVFFLCCYLLFIGYPILMEGGSKLKWHLLQLKN